MKTPEQIAEDAARAVLIANIENIDIYSPDEDPLTALGWALGEGIEYEDGLKQLVARASEVDRAQFFDTAGSASRQHYIDTGRYLLHEEVAEMKGADERECDNCGDEVTYLSSRDWCDGCEERDAKPKCDECDVREGDGDHLGLQVELNRWPMLNPPVQLCDGCEHNARRSGWEPGK